MSRVFSAAGHGLEVANNSAYDGSVGTVAFWFLPTALTAFSGICGRHDAASHSGFTVYIDATGTLSAQCYHASALSESLPGVTALATGGWYHGVLVFDQGAGNLNALYLNGGLEVSTTVGFAWTFNGQVIRVARLLDAFWAQFSGNVAELAWWNVKLSANEIKSLAGGTRPRRIQQGKLVDYWPLMQGTSPEPSWTGSGRSASLLSTPGTAGNPPVQA